MTTRLNKLISTKMNRRDRIISFSVLGAVLAGLLVVGALNLWKAFGPKYYTTTFVPFGLKSGEKIQLGIDHTLDRYFRDLEYQHFTGLQQANELRSAGRCSEAIISYESLLAHKPTLVPARVGLIDCRLKQSTQEPSYFARIESDIISLSSLSQNHPVVSFLRASSLLLQDRRAEGIELLEQIVRESPQYSEAWQLLGQLYLESGNLAQSQLALRTALSLDKGNSAKLYALLGQNFHDQGYLDSCQALVSHALGKHPHNPDLLYLKALLLDYNGEYDRAETLYNTLQGLNPDDSRYSEALTSLGTKNPPSSDGNSDLRVDPSEKARIALDILQPLVDQYPENTPLRFALGKALFASRLFFRAQEEFERIIQSDSTFPEIDLYLQKSKDAGSRKFAREEILSTHRLVDSLRSITPSDIPDPSERLGHYLVRWGLSPAEFFKKVSPQRFTQKSDFHWVEQFIDEARVHTYTLLFDSTGYYGVHVLVKDTNFVNNPRVFTDLFGAMISLNSRISGQGTSTGQSSCEGSSFQGVVWETRDNFELLAQLNNKKDEIRIIRLERSHLPPSQKMCDYLPFLLKF
jgi:tetratricopeptide (TPR) repeat protein